MHTALNTRLQPLLGCRVPIMLAGMGGVARHALAAAVGNAGGFPCLGMVREPVSRILTEIAAYRSLCSARFAVNLIPAATAADLLRAQVAACLAEQVPAMVLFWDVDADLVRHVKAEGVQVIHQVGTIAAAEMALAAGADVLIAQGHEAGGHVHGTTSLFGLLPELAAISPVPIVAAGGVGSGAAIVAALALGADGVSLGSAFLATHEANAHLHHQRRLIDARGDQTIYTTQFVGNWHQAAPVRVLANAVTRGERQHEFEQGLTPAIGEQDGLPVHLFSTDSPLADASGQLDDMALYAGQSCGQINELGSASQRIKQLLDQAEECLKKLTDPT